MKKLGIFLLTIAAIIISSCGLSDENTPEACSFDISQALDKGNYDYVIQKLEADPTCKGAFTQEEGKINLAAAYIGKAGFDITSLINDMLKSNNQSQDTYALFALAISKRASGSTIQFLEKAKQIYSEIFGNIDCKDKNALENQPDVVKDACFYSGLVDIAKATTSIALLIGGDETDPNQIAQLVEDWANAKNNTTQNQCSETDVNANGIPDNADATACALQYAVALSDNDNTNDSIPFNCGNGTSVNSRNEPITFSNLSTNFINLNIEIQPDTNCSTQYQTQTFKRLIYNIGNNIYTTAVTNGYCDVNFNTCDKTQNGCYPCPVITEYNNNPAPTSTADVIIETINEGADTITAVIPQQDKADLKQTIVDFKKDLCSAGPTACVCVDANGSEVNCTDTTAVNNAVDVKIKSPIQDPNVQQLISDYLQNK